MPDTAIGTSVCVGLPPVATPRVRVLVLGSMPGAASLAAGRYYAHPRNAFWRLMDQLLAIGTELPYAQRVEALLASGVGLWDVFARCERKGSLDTAIRASEANDFGAFLQTHPGVTGVLFNGAAAEAGFRRLVLPALRSVPRVLHRLPSTSPANAAMSWPGKCVAWSAGLRAAGIDINAPAPPGAQSALR